jgi:hypothetical protein
MKIATTISSFLLLIVICSCSIPKVSELSGEFEKIKTQAKQNINPQKSEFTNSLNDIAELANVIQVPNDFNLAKSPKVVKVSTNENLFISALMQGPVTKEASVKEWKSCFESKGFKCSFKEEEHGGEMECKKTANKASHLTFLNDPQQPKFTNVIVNYMEVRGI